MPRTIRNDDWRQPLMYGLSNAELRLEAVKIASKTTGMIANLLINAKMIEDYIHTGEITPIRRCVDQATVGESFGGG